MPGVLSISCLCSWHQSIMIFAARVEFLIESFLSTAFSPYLTAWCALKSPLMRQFDSSLWVGRNLLVSFMFGTYALTNSIVVLLIVHVTDKKLSV